MLAIAVPAGAPAQDEDTIGSQPGSAPAPQIGGSLPEKPKGFLTSPREAIKLADTDPKVIEVSAERGRLEIPRRGQASDHVADRLLRRRQGGRPGPGRRPHQDHPRVVDGKSGRLADGPRLQRPVRPPAERALRLDPARAALLLRPLRLPPLEADGPPRPAGAALVRGEPVLLRQGRHRRLGPARLPAARLPALPNAVDRVQGPARRPQPLDPAHLARDRDDVPDRLPRRAQHRRLGHDRRRLRRRDRRRQAHPRRPDLSGGRPRLRPRQPVRRHLRPGQLLRLRPVRARDAVERRVGRAAGVARRGDLLRPGDDRAGCSSWGGGCGGRRRMRRRRSSAKRDWRATASG